ncbi:MAG: MotA/TolQ/ExbB proton channel family protein [Lachnospiraceae bacterium]
MNLLEQVVSILIENFLGLDMIIIGLAVANALFFYLPTKMNTDKIYSHFNKTDKTSNLNNNSKKAFGILPKEEKLSVDKLLDYREKMNKSYSYFSNISTMFPLFGMLGTVMSLMPIVGSADANFFEALTSTFWGIVFAIIFKALDAGISYKIDDNEKHMDYFFNPGNM